MEIASGDYRNGHRFGFGTYSLSDHETHQLNLTRDTEVVRQTALNLAWSHGCPIALELTDPANTEYGPIAMAKRYSEVNQWFRYIQAKGKRNPFLCRGLTVPTLRLANEPVGHYEEESVPPSHKTHIAPMTGIVGYALPRIFIESINAQTRRYWDEPEHLRLPYLISKSQRVDELLARLSESTFIYTKARATSILHHTLAVGVLTEENCRTAFENLANQLSEHAPFLMREYNHLSPTDKQAHGIAEL